MQLIKLYQAIWVFEIAARFPFIMKYLKNSQLISEFILSTILDNYFLHFAGGGADAKVWLQSRLLKKINKKLISEFQSYYDKKLQEKRFIEEDKDLNVQKTL